MRNIIESDATEPIHRLHALAWCVLLTFSVVFPPETSVWGGVLVPVALLGIAALLIPVGAVRVDAPLSLSAAVFLLAGLATAIHPTRSLTTLGVFAALAFAYAASRSLREEEATRVRDWWIVLAASAAGYAIYQWGYGFDQLLDEISRFPEPERSAFASRILSGRVFATFETPSAFAGFLALTLPITAGALIEGGGRARRGWLAAAGALQLAAFALTRSLSGVMALGGAAVLAAFLGSRSRLWRWGTVAAGIAGGASVVWLRFTEFQEIGGASPLHWRWQNWFLALRMLREHPLLGLGGGGYGTAYPQYMESGMNQTHYVHNTYLQLVLEHGLWVAPLLGWFLWKLGRRGVGALRHLDRGTRLREGPLIVALAAFALHNAVDFTFHLPGVAIGFAFLAGRLWASPEPSPAMPARQRWVLGGAALVVTLVLLQGAVGRMAYVEAKEALRDGDQAGARMWVEAGVHLVPRDPDLQTLRAQLLYDLRGEDPANLDAALASAQKAVSLEPRTSHRHAVLAKIYFAKGDRLRATLHLGAAARLFPASEGYRVLYEKAKANLEGTP